MEAMEEKDQTMKRRLIATDLLEMGEEAEWCEWYDPRVLTSANTLSGDDVIPGFACRVAELLA